jgi:hypothetical protein
MSGINVEELERAQRAFEKYLSKPEHNPWPDDRADSIREKLSSMGLDLNADATYELIEEGLTKQKFEDLEFLAVTYAITGCFHRAQDIAKERYNGAAVKHETMKYLLEAIKEMEEYRPHLKGRSSLPEDADPYHRWVAERILGDYKSGKLQEYCDDLAVGHAVESYKGLLKVRKIIAEDLSSGHETSRYELWTPLREIKKIKELVGSMTEGRKAKFFAGTGADQSGLDKLHREGALIVARASIEKGRIISNTRTCFSSGECHLYAEDILKSAGVDMNSDATYAALGLDKRTFRANCKREAGEMNPASGNPPKVNCGF